MFQDQDLVNFVLISLDDISIQKERVVEDRGSLVLTNNLEKAPASSTHFHNQPDQSG